uniref:Uncharacterized protein n=1 Tax=Tanacetum cinerariifolium TaxID=118510 RepID=A0A6L2LPC1_TANCI|nr:hypothetical protein [Tanacetum cinerariifolium]
MVVNTVKEMTMNFGKLDKFKGHDFRVQESDKGNGKEVGGPFVNMIEEGGKNKHHKQNKGKKWSNENNSGSSSNKKTKLECWKCGKTGHFKRYYRSGNKKNANASGSGKGSKDKSQDQDSGATNYVCKDRCWFKTYELVKDGSVLYMGDDHFAPVHGKGSVALEFSSGKTITLFNVLYVPKLHKNLVSGPMLNKYRYKQVYESDKYILSKSGVFVGFGYYNNGHVHYKRMLEMSKDDLIPAIDENPEKCTTSPYTPQQNGVAKGKIELLRKWFYVIEPNDSVSINSIIESRDAIFDENCFSLIPRPKDIIPNLVESQRDDHSNDVPSETLEPRKGFRQKEWINYFDTYAQIARITTIRLLLALTAIHNLVIHQMDVKTKFLNGDLEEEVYIKQSKGFVMSGNEHKVCKTDQNQVDKTKKFLSSRFSMKDMGEAVLGNMIKRENKGIVITQSHYIEKILKKFNHEDYSLVSTPMDPIKKLKPNTGKPMDQLKYSRAIGCLMHAMISTRPDIAYAVDRLSRFTSNPSRQHWQAITRVFKYLKGTINYGLSYVGYPSVLEAYSDASWINHIKDSSFMSGWVFLLGGGAISWASKKQM